MCEKAWFEELNEWGYAVMRANNYSCAVLHMAQPIKCLLPQGLFYLSRFRGSRGKYWMSTSIACHSPRRLWHQHIVPFCYDQARTASLLEVSNSDVDSQHTHRSFFPSIRPSWLRPLTYCQCHQRAFEYNEQFGLNCRWICPISTILWNQLNCILTHACNEITNLNLNEDRLQMDVAKSSMDIYCEWKNEWLRHLSPTKGGLFQNLTGFCFNIWT